MNNILVVAYYFPPSGGPGVQRVLKHIKYLREFGWMPTVLTVSNGQYPALDHSLIEQIPSDIEVVKTKIFEPYDIYRLLTGKKKGSPIDVNVIKKDGQKSNFTENLAEFIRATFFIPDARTAWQLTAVKAGLEIIKRKNIKAIYSSSPPYTCSLIARSLKRKTGLPWVAGFRDPWTGFISSPKRWLLPAMIDRSMEKSTFVESDYVEVAWKGISKDACAKYPDLDYSKFIHSPNGYDPDDYPKEKIELESKFTLTYTGSMYGRRNPASLFAALEKLIAQGKIEATDFKLRFIGRFGDEVIAMFNKASFKESIEVISYLPHEESIKYLFKSHALLLIVDESKESDEIVPGKVYEYLGTGKPLFVIATETGAIAELIEETGAGMVAEHQNIEKIANNFLNYFSQYISGISIESDMSIISKYERKNSSKILANLLDKLIV